MEAKRRNYDLEDRLIKFAVLVCRIAERLPSTRVGNHVAGQLIRCSTSPAPNYGEAQSDWNPELGEHLSIDDLFNTTKIYTSLIINTLMKTREEIGDAK